MSRKESQLIIQVESYQMRILNDEARLEKFSHAIKDEISKIENNTWQLGSRVNMFFNIQIGGIALDNGNKVPGHVHVIYQQLKNIDANLDELVKIKSQGGEITVEKADKVSVQFEKLGKTIKESISSKNPFTQVNRSTETKKYYHYLKSTIDTINETLGLESTLRFLDHEDYFSEQEEFSDEKSSNDFSPHS
jgi:hypothetical protein